MGSISSNAITIEQELDWFQKLILLRGKITFEQSLSEKEISNLEIPSIKNHNSPYALLINKYAMGFEERLVLILALIPHVKPSLLDLLHMKNELYDIPFTEFGGIRYDKHKGYLPTGETAIFILAGNNLKNRFELLRLFNKDHFFHRDGILILKPSSLNEPLLYGLLSISQEHLSLCTTGKVFKPDYSQLFPAKRLYTSQVWDDLVVPNHIIQGLEEIRNYIAHGKTLKNNYQFGKKIKPGFKVLFTGPPGTGKTLTASLLGQHCQMDVYRIDLSMVVSKYIGETEKNLSRVFDMAESKDWILFFDEADALFGKRSHAKDSHDRYANQEVSFLLQRIEDFDGLVILSSNFKKNIDQAFFRRFQLILDFEIPDAEHRLTLWRKSKTDEFEYDKEIDLQNLSDEYELSAASIINILHYCVLKCLSINERTIRYKDIQAGLRIEKIKEGKSIV
ncbi:ATP-binding protein [Saccharicrinis sp. 156]|uniref:ATP-binding protein n=1 Tax=Saccharicrinis sp. 156 TaxID=3417574 RepID=UPI003D32B628